MKEGPDIASIAALIGDPARANMLTALMSGRALTASELAQEAGVTAPTASSHLKQLTEGGMVSRLKQGRHHYFSLAGEDVGAVLEGLMGMAARRGQSRVRTGPRDPALRHARICYDHLAGEMGVHLMDSLRDRSLIVIEEDRAHLTASGRAAMESFGIDLDGLDAARRPTCRACLDWSARRPHLAGGVGAALLTRIMANGWARREEGTRCIRFSRAGETAFLKQFPVS